MSFGRTPGGKYLLSGHRHRAYRLWAIVLVAVVVLYLPCMYLAAHSHDRRFPATITNSISFDAKLRFLRDTPQLFNAQTLCCGSSMCLTNVDSAYLQRQVSGIGPVVNLGAWGLQVEDTARFAQFFIEHAPGVRRVVLSLQIVDCEHNSKKPMFDAGGTWAYLSQQEGPGAVIKHFNVSKAIKNWRSYDRVHRNNTSYDGLLFDETGAVLLDLPTVDRGSVRWNSAAMDVAASSEAMKSLDSFSRWLHQKNIHCTIVVPPLRKAFHQNPASLQRLNAFKSRVREITIRNGGLFVDADEQLQLGDDYFVDMVHLNSRGARRVAEILIPLL